MQGGHEAIIYVGNFKKYFYISDISVALPKNIVIFAVTFVVWRFRNELTLCWQQWSEAMKCEMLHCFNISEVLNASSLHRYEFYSAFNASLLYFFKEDHRLTLHRRYLFTEIHCLIFIAVTFLSNFAHLRFFWWKNRRCKILRHSRLRAQLDSDYFQPSNIQIVFTFIFKHQKTAQLPRPRVRNSKCCTNLSNI